MAEPLAQRTPLRGDQIRASIGALFFALSLIYVIKTVTAASRELSAG